MKKRFPHYTQLDAMDCGPACLRMIAKYYGRSYSLQTLRERAFITREGVSMLGISEAAETIGFRTSGVKVTLKQLAEELPLPCVLHWNQSHFVVCYKIKNGKYYIADPAAGLVVYNEEEIKNVGAVLRSKVRIVVRLFYWSQVRNFMTWKMKRKKEAGGFLIFSDMSGLIKER